MSICYMLRVKCVASIWSLCGARNRVGVIGVGGTRFMVCRASMPRGLDLETGRFE